jgi:glycosyltransferase involved in cell wall biosynthesis
MNEITKHQKSDNTDVLRYLEEVAPEGGTLDYYSKPIESLRIHGFTSFYTLLLAIWQLRPHDLQLNYDLHTAANRFSYLGWCVTAGIKEYKSLGELKPLWDELSLPAEIPATKWSGAISKLMQVVIFARQDLEIDFELMTEEQQLKAVTWFFCSNGYKEVKSPGPMPLWQYQFLLGAPSLTSSRLADLMYTQRKDLQLAFDISTNPGLKNFNTWIENNGLYESGVGIPNELNFKTNTSDYVDDQSDETASTSTLLFGVNLIGYAYGELGIGEDVRMAAKSLNAAGVPFTVFNFSPGEGVRQQDISVKEWVRDTLPYSINIVCLTALEHVRLFAEYGHSIFRGRYTIGYWPWELQLWPSKWNHCFNLVDEVWASSTYIKTAFESASAKPSHRMPMAVSVPYISENKLAIRTRYGIDKNAISFIFSFDGNSSINRKNPLGVMAAFIAAFSEGTERVELIIKSMRSQSTGSAWIQIEEAARKDNRIKVIDDVLTKQEVLSLYSACDCFVSLHRSEGFGRGIAEALMLDLSVIATGYGGNIDFCQPLGGAMISYNVIPTTASCYVESKNNYWAEPNIQDAAEHMKRIYRLGHTEMAERVGFSERNSKMLDIFSHRSVGTRYLDRLQKIFANCGQ